MIEKGFYNNWKHKSISIFSITWHLAWKKQLSFQFDIEILGLNFWVNNYFKENN